MAEETEVPADPVSVLKAAAEWLELVHESRTISGLTWSSGALASACAAAAADLEAMVAAAAARPTREVKEDDRRRVFEIGFSAGFARQKFLEAEATEAGWPEGEPEPPDMPTAWAMVAAALARGS